MPSLSICIPTFNRSKYLAELLDSIIAQGLPEIEVVVSDDASQDDTVAVAAAYRERIKNFKFIRQPKNIGLDRNFVAVTAAASGDYLWLMGDDDRLESGGAQLVITALERWPKVVGLTVGVVDYDSTMQRVTGVRAMPETQLLTGAIGVFTLLTGVIGFMSAMIVERQKWEAASTDSHAQLMNNLYSQLYIIGQAVGRDGTWGVVKDLCVGFRSDNDQFKRNVGWLERLKIDVRAYDEIATLLFADSPPTHRAVRKQVFDTHVMARLVNAKTADMDNSIRQILVAATYLARNYGTMPSFWIRGLPLVLAPRFAVSALRSVYKRLASSSGAARARRVR